MNPVRVFVADDHAMVRSGLRLLLEREPDLAVVGEAPDGRAALEHIASEQPDVAVIDVAMPGLNGIEAASQIARKFPGVGIVMLSMHSDETYVLRCLRAGGQDSYDLLTEREREVLQLIAEGPSNKEIAVSLFLSVYTVETHRKNILEKLNLRGTADLILYAVRKAIIQ